MGHDAWSRMHSCADVTSASDLTAARITRCARVHTWARSVRKVTYPLQRSRRWKSWRTGCCRHQSRQTVRQRCPRTRHRRLGILRSPRQSRQHTNTNDVLPELSTSTTSTHIHTQVTYKRSTSTTPRTFTCGAVIGDDGTTDDDSVSHGVTSNPCDACVQPAASVAASVHACSEHATTTHNIGTSVPHVPHPTRGGRPSQHYQQQLQRTSTREVCSRVHCMERDGAARYGAAAMDVRVHAAAVTACQRMIQCHNLSNSQGGGERGWE